MRSNGDFRTGLAFAVASAAAFGLSGPFAKALMGAGWSPTAAVTARLAGGALVMALVAGAVRPGWLREAATHRRTVIAYGIAPIAGAQFCYYNAVERLPVGVALLLEYTAPVLVVGWLWATSGRRPTAPTLLGVAFAVAGLVVVLDIAGGAAGRSLDIVGVAWGLAAAVCAASYFLLSARAAADGSGVHPVTLAAAGLLVGAVTVGALGLAGAVPMTFATADTVVAGLPVPWWVPVAVLAVVATALAYGLGIVGIARLRPGFASLVGLCEVLFAVVAAWALLAERLTPVQAVGGAVVLLGLALARHGDRSSGVPPAAPEPTAAPDATTDSRPGLSADRRGSARLRPGRPGVRQ